MSKKIKKFNENYNVKKIHQPCYLIAYVKKINKFNENYKLKKDPSTMLSYCLCQKFKI
jgi:hypothetical protein